MNLRRLFSLSSLLLASTMGCCHSRCVHTDPCDPCNGMVSGRRHVSGWMNHKVSSWRMRNHGRNYGWNDVACGCDACGMGFDGDMISSGCGSGGCGGMAVGGSPSGCGCGQQHSEYAPSVPGTIPIPPATPAVAPSPVPVPPAGNEPAPAPASSETNSTAIQRAQVQQVSVEEFQRLPGVIVSGPTLQSAAPSITTAASSAQPLMAVPQLSPIPTAPQTASGAQQLNWVPTKP